MIPLIIFSIAAMDADIVAFRHEHALEGWRNCIVIASEKLKQNPELKDMDEGVLELSKAMCENMAADFRNAAPDYLMQYGRKKGLNRSGQEAMAKAMLEDYVSEIEATLTINGVPAPQ